MRQRGLIAHAKDLPDVALHFFHAAIQLDASIALRGNGQPPRAIAIFECARKLHERGATREQVDAMTRARAAGPEWSCPSAAKAPIADAVTAPVIAPAAPIVEARPAQRSPLPLVGWLIAGAGAAVGAIVGTAFFVGAGSAQSDFDALLADLTARSAQSENITGELPRLGALDLSAREGRQSGAAALAVGGAVLAVGLVMVIVDAASGEDVAWSPAAAGPGGLVFQF